MTAAPSPHPGRVLLHVGTPKTGTSYLQEALFHNRELLEGHGIRYPADRFDAHFLAALDLMALPWGGLETEAVGAWDRLAEQVRAWPHTSVVSHEILATATRAQADRALTSLGIDDGAEIHLVVSVRDLVRQIPAEWQENVKHRATVTYAEFLELIRDPARESRIGAWFWGVQEIPDILDRWGWRLPPERVHVVTVPPPGAPPGELWARFCRVFELEGIDLDLTIDRSNPSLGVPETALLRSINAEAHRVVAPADYRPLVRELLAHRTLSRRTGSPRLGLSPDVHAWVDELSRSWIATMRERGYAVEGDLDEIAGAAPGPWVDPDTCDPGDQLPGALDAIGALLLEAVRLRESEARVAHELHETRAALEAAHFQPTYRLRKKVVRTMEDSAVGRGTLGAYRRLRGRSSRSA